MEEPKIILTSTELQSKAGRKRAESLSPERRSEIARIAGLNKGKKGLPRATHDGTLKFGDMQIACAVLDGGIRVISNRAMREALGLSKPSREAREKAAGGNLPTFLTSNALKPYFEEVFGGVMPSTINFVGKSGSKTEGILATQLVSVCEVYLKARSDGVLHKNQLHIADMAEIILRGLAKTGIIALVDEVTNFQEERARDELQTLLKKFISEDLLKWTQKFPHSFFKNVYRLHGWKYSEGQCRHPSYVGQIINKYIYAKLPKGILEELKRINPLDQAKGHRKHQHHRLLTEDIGQPVLEKHLIRTIGLMEASDNKEEFEKLFNRSFARSTEDVETEKS